MKKIVALMLALTVVFSFAIISAYANESRFTFTVGEVEIEKDATTIDVPVTVHAASYPSNLAGFNIVFNSANLEGLKLTSVTGMPSGLPLDGSANLDNFSIAIASDGSDIAISEDFVLTLTFSATGLEEGKTYKLTFVDGDLDAYDATYEWGADACTFVPGAITVKAAGPAVKTITKTGTDVLINNAKEKSEGVTTAEQIGGAAGFAFTIPAGVKLDDNMIWSLTTSEGKKFSQKVNAGLSALSGDVKVAATFVTGSHLAGEGRTPFNFEITAADGIFKAGEDFYFTDAADAALKAE